MGGGGAGGLKKSKQWKFSNGMEAASMQEEVKM